MRLGKSGQSIEAAARILRARSVHSRPGHLQVFPLVLYLVDHGVYFRRSAVYNVKSSSKKEVANVGIPRPRWSP